MSVEAMAWALNRTDVGGTDKLVLIGICNHDGDGGAWPTVETLARYASVEPRAVRKAVSRLEERGLVTRRVNEGGTPGWKDNRRPNLYVIHREVPPDRPTSDREVPPDHLGRSHGTVREVPPDLQTVHKPSTEPSNKNFLSDGDAVLSEAGASPSLDVAVLTDERVTWNVPAVVVEGGLLEQAVELCEVLATSLRDRGERVPPSAPVSKGWVLPMELMLRADGRTPHEVLRVIRWLDAGRDRTSQFWRTNIRSPKKLRQHYARMAEQYQRDRAPAQRNAVLADAAATGPSIADVYEGARRYREQANGPG